MAEVASSGKPPEHPDSSVVPGAWRREAGDNHCLPDGGAELRVLLRPRLSATRRGRRLRHCSGVLLQHDIPLREEGKPGLAPSLTRPPGLRVARPPGLSVEEPKVEEVSAFPDERCDGPVAALSFGHEPGCYASGGLFSSMKQRPQGASRRPHPAKHKGVRRLVFGDVPEASAGPVKDGHIQQFNPRGLRGGKGADQSIVGGVLAGKPRRIRLRFI